MPATEAVRLAELMAALSQATDIGLGTAPEHAQRSALVTVALADAAGLGQDEARQAFYLTLLKTIGCTGDEDVTARIFGEDAGTWIAHIGGASPARGAARGRRQRGPVSAPAAASAQSAARAGYPAPHAAGDAGTLRGRPPAGAALGSVAGGRARHGPGVRALGRAGGSPGRLKGEAIDRPVRVAQLAADAQAAQRMVAQ